MAQQAITGVFVVCMNLEGFQHAADRTNDLVCFLVFDHAGLYRHDVVGFLFVDTGNGFSLAVTKYCMDFVAVMEWIIHAFDAVYFTIISEKLLHLALFHLELLFVRHVQILTAAAAMSNRTKPLFLCLLRLFCRPLLLCRCLCLCFCVFLKSS